LTQAKGIAVLAREVQRQHPSAPPADPSKLDPINTYAWLPEFYIDKPFWFFDCGKEEIRKAADENWYCQETKAHMDAAASLLRLSQSTEGIDAATERWCLTLWRKAKFSAPLLSVRLPSPIFTTLEK